MAEITGAELDAILSGDPDEIGVHLHLVERDVEIDGHKVRVYCHCLVVSGQPITSGLKLQGMSASIS
ncbi:hypothetical protein GCM10011491_46440 [Brucella endophytica]|uniref:Uncharacterized protein n=1 Tax=Brucella endophytica TaxID=1963359 RepID=A0A916SU37_9HYPH|nr:hypothetical protein [Brucella endophytica]GGB13429.1 hypothetical protein GCM10011491_46440 [Brucella endophytica]